MNAQLTKNFGLAEFLRSQTARRHGIDMTPSAQVIANLARLCSQVLQPLRDRINAPIIITSGYRPLEVNRIIGGSSRSQHVAGLAADLVVPLYSVDDVFNALSESRLPYDQLIHEFGQWVHVSINAPKAAARGQRLYAMREKGAVLYQAA